MVDDDCAPVNEWLLRRLFAEKIIDPAERRRSARKADGTCEKKNGMVDFFDGGASLERSSRMAMDCTFRSNSGGGRKLDEMRRLLV